jgi:hypothetical protein
MTTQLPTRAGAGMAGFEATTSRWGRITMLAGLVLSLIGPCYLVFFGGLDITANHVWLAFLAVATTFGIFWVMEPLTYFPILGSAAMYQAFMIGNISNKLLPAAIVAQSTVNARPGTKRGDLAAAMAICGAATVHLTSLLLFVGVLGTWLISIIPAELIDVARLYILPAVMGAVLVQIIATMKQLRPTIFAIAIALVVQFVLVPLVPQLALGATAIGVAATIALSWFGRDRTVTHHAHLADHHEDTAPKEEI